MIDEATNRKIAIKLIYSLSNKSFLSGEKIYNIKPFLIEYCIYKLLSTIDLGLKIPNTFGFDLICFEDSLMFPIEYAKTYGKLTLKE